MKVLDSYEDGDRGRRVRRLDRFRMLRNIFSKSEEIRSGVRGCLGMVRGDYYRSLGLGIDCEVGH